MISSGVFGWYLLGPLLGPTLGPLFGGIIVQHLGWRWIFWILTIVCSFNTIVGFVFLKETYAPVILEARKEAYIRSSDSNTKYRMADQDDRPFRTKLASSMARPLRILFTQPIVLTMAIYQAILFGTTYSLYTNFQAIYGSLYGFNTTQVGLMYLGPGLGFMIAVWFIVPKIDTVYNQLADKNDGDARPEFRLPLANVGAVFIPVSLFWFAWTVEYIVHWTVPLLSTVFFGLGQITILNTVQNYYIDSFSKYAASAIAAGAVFRSIVGGIVPLGASQLFDKLGYGLGISVFAFLSLALSPAPVLFYRYGQGLRERFAIEL
jgi:MFS family permease